METQTKGYNLFTTINGFKLSYNDIGTGKIPIIFLHGFPFDKSMWQGQLDYLKSSSRVIAYDIRGFGASKDEESVFSMDLFTDDLIAFMDSLAIEKATLCGLSMGGYIALNAVKRFPTRFSALILCDTQCIADTPEVFEKRANTIVEIQKDGVAMFNEAFIKSVLHEDSFNTKLELVEQLRTVVNANSARILTMGLTALAERSETCSSLSKIAIPTLIICGRADVVTPLAESQAMNQNIKGSTLCVIEHAGHVSNLEQPIEFNKVLHGFVTNLNGGGAMKVIENRSSL